jgi:integrase
MPLEPYVRGNSYWVRGRIELNGVAITGYYRQTTGATSEAGARDWCRAEEDRQTRRHILGEEEAVLTFSDAVLKYPFKPKEARLLIPLVEEIGNLPVPKITGKLVRDLGPKIYPNAATDTWWRQVVTPVRAVINNAHEHGLCAPIRVKVYKDTERIEQDKARGKKSRVERQPITKEWVGLFCAHADPYNAAMVRFMFETGARIDQATSLTRDDLDLSGQLVWIKAQKGHDAQWVDISRGMMIELANLPAKQPRNFQTGEWLAPKVFGYAGPGNYRKRWKTICRNAGIEMLTAHCCRHGFYTELRVNQGFDPITAAKAGRWKNHSLPDRVYAHVEENLANIRELMRTPPVQGAIQNSPNAMKQKGK